MIYITKLILISSVVIFATSCSNIPVKQMFPMIKASLFGIPQIEISENFIDSQPYSFIKVRIGKSSQAILVLSTIKDDIYVWVSSTGEKIYTFNGKIIKTHGLNYNLEEFSPKFFPNIRLSQTFTHNILLSNPKKFVTQNSLIESFSNQSSNNLLISETITTDGFRWSYKNYYEYKNGVESKTRQYIHPELPVIDIEFYYK